VTDDFNPLAWAVGAWFALLAMLVLTSCSAGPQLPVITTPVTINCTWNAPDSGAISDCDCLVDRASAPVTRTTGNDNQGARVDVPVTVGVGQP
jgi:hypothetical protein